MGQLHQWQESQSGQEASPIIRLFNPGGGGPSGLSADMTVREFHYAYFRPSYLLTKGSADRNYEAIDQSVELWAEFTEDPPVNRITLEHTREFVSRLMKLPGKKAPLLANNTIRKHCSAIQSILDLFGPKDRKHRDSLGLLDWSEVPYISRPPKEDKAAEDCFMFEEVQQLIDNVKVATSPHHLPCSPGEYMMRLYVACFNTTMRIGGAMGAFWSNYHPGVVDANGNVFDRHLILQAGVGAKGRKDMRIEINDATAEVFELMRGYDPVRIFPWPKWPTSRSQLFKQHRLIRACLPKHRQFGTHAVRKLANNELARLNPKACEKAMGHKSGVVNVENYTSRIIVQETLKRMPVLRTKPTKPDPQRHLFE